MATRIFVLIFNIQHWMEGFFGDCLVLTQIFKDRKRRPPLVHITSAKLEKYQNNKIQADFELTR
jgi:hypothetical protein